jgi:catechol 2,3-dioxygenase-like lactoylglutathione lyase family enzyme
MVDDQDRALRFYTEVLGFRKKHEIPVGEYRWITMTSPEGPDDLELALEPNANPASKTFQEAMFSQGIPLAAFEVSDIAGEIDEMRARYARAAALLRELGDRRALITTLGTSALPGACYWIPGPVNSTISRHSGGTLEGASR